MRRFVSRSPLAVVALGSFLHTYGGLGALAASGHATLKGRITTKAGASVPHALLKVADVGTRTVFSSRETAGDGHYTLGDLPAGTYDLAIETKDGLFLGDSLVVLASGETRAMNVAVEPQAEPPSEDSPEEAQAPAKAAAKRTGFWKNPLTINLLFLGTAVIVGVVVDDDEKAASPSQP